MKTCMDLCAKIALLTSLCDAFAPPANPRILQRRRLDFGSVASSSPTALHSIFLLDPIARGIGLVSATGMKKQQSGMEVGIKAAQLLLDPRRHEELKKDIKKRYPFVPNDILDSVIDLTAQSFTDVAPKELKDALRPGGMEKLRPQLESTLVSLLLEQKFVKDIPIISAKDKKQVVEGVVDRALDYVLKDAEEVLASPEVRLESLEEKRSAIFREMGRRRVWIYRIRHNPKTVLSIAASIVLSGLLYWQRETEPVMALTSLVSSAAGKIYAGTAFIAAKIALFTKLIWIHLALIAKFSFKKICIGGSWLITKIKVLVGIS